MLVYQRVYPTVKHNFNLNNPLILKVSEVSGDYQKIIRSIRSPHESKEQHGVYPSLPFSSFCLLDENLLRVRVLCGRLLGLPQPVIPVAPGICHQKIHQIGVSKWGIPEYP